MNAIPPDRAPRFVPIPAVDIRGGLCVRLLRGEFDQETVYGGDPVECAQRWVSEGARRLHVVDLDGARDGVRQNADAVARLLRETRVPVQVGGGIRTLETARMLIGQGADRVVVGTAAAEDFAHLRKWVETLTPERLVVGVDARHGQVVIRGWREVTQHTVGHFCARLRDAGVVRVLYTDVGRDGTLEGPDVSTIRTLVSDYGLRVLASGGVASLDHLRDVANAGAEGAIIGKALYAGVLRLPDVVAEFDHTEAGTC